MRLGKALIIVVVIAVAACGVGYLGGYLRPVGRPGGSLAGVPDSGTAVADGTQTSPANQSPTGTTLPPANTDPNNSGAGNSSSASNGSGSGGSSPGGHASEPAHRVHSILGRSKNLTDKQWQTMLAWREAAATFAGSHAGVYVNGWPSGKEVCLTFDDGPDGTVTPQVLDILEQYDIKASFFFIGKQLEENRDVVKRAYNDGDLVLSHTWDHKQLISLTADQIRAELQQSEDKLDEIIGARPAIVRPPYGDIDGQVAKVLRDSGDTAVLWSIDTLDWSQREKDNIVGNVVNNVRSGDIILMHSTSAQTVDVAALPEIITQLEKQGYKFVTLSELLGVPAYK